MNFDVQKINELAKQAGAAILKIYHQDFEVEYKTENDFLSPLTQADLASHYIIEKGLSKLYPSIPILSEESKDISFKERGAWNVFWLIDPLDGTKEFIKKNDEFTINIALISKGEPVLGVVYIPVTDILYFTDGKNSYKQVSNKSPVKLPLKKENDCFVIVASKSHFTTETEEFINKINKEHASVEFISAGSSLKLCLVAEGKADIYPRLATTMEWDTAAAHAILKIAGKNVCHFKTGIELKYNKERLLNPWFIVK